MKFWEISDSFWEAVKPLIPENVRDPKRVYQRIAGGGRKPLDSRKVFEAIVYVLKTGTQWKALPKDIFGSPSSIHAYFKKWEEQGFFSEMWKKGLAEYEEMKGIAWEWTLDTTRSAKAAMERMNKAVNGEGGEAAEGETKAQSCPTLCDPMNHSMPGLPVHHQLSESAPTHVHRVGDAIQPSHPLSSPSLPAPSPSQH